MLAVSSQATWYLTRGTGLMTMLLLTASVVLGIVTTVRWKTDRWPRFITAALHRNISLLVVVFLAIHIVTSVVDSFAPIHWIDVVVPLGATYRPLWLGLGALSFDLLVAITVTSLVRQRIGYTTWRVVHWMSYACWPAAILHGLGTGSDTKVGWALALTLCCVIAVVAAVWWRLAVGWPAFAGRRVAAGVATVIAPVALVVWLLTGPTRPGWARRAGTPASLLGSANAAASSPAGGSASASASAPGSASQSGSASSGAASFRPPFDASFTGTLSQQGATVVIDGTLSDGVTGHFRLELDMRGDGQILDGKVSMGPANQPALFTGLVIQARGGRFVARLENAAGDNVDVTVSLSSAGAGGSSVVGDVRGTADVGAPAGGGSIRGGG